jgi:putative membrane protein
MTFLNPQALVATLVYSFVGVLVFMAAYKVMEKLFPFNLSKELAEDQNTAVAIVMGAVIIGLSVIIATALHG